MCLTIPFRIKTISGRRAELENGRQVGIDLITDPQIGDWVLVNADLAIRKIDRQEAEETLDYFKGEKT